jgi:hypothetical protein
MSDKQMMILSTLEDILFSLEFIDKRLTDFEILV